MIQDLLAVIFQAYAAQIRPKCAAYAFHAVARCAAGPIILMENLFPFCLVPFQRQQAGRFNLAA